ncbi:flagellin N-terminal helical domain-containing protein [Rhizobium sp. RAF56]|jgi:flagellin|uniref:flagellin N-terminal helical domain-containing protein n=1 Tax=Rhizobium sp. RAF56 TaxID=3233062 RepID=UPI003F9CD3DA
MNSVTTNAASLGALTVLSGVTKQLNAVQKEVSSGHRIDSASDDPTYWSMATTMRSDVSSLSTISDALGLSSGKVDTTYTTMEKAIDLLTQIRSKLTTAQEAGVDKTQINSDLSDLKAQLAAMAQSASFSGENWLYNSSPVLEGQKSIISNFTRGSSGEIRLSAMTYDSSQALMIDTSDPSRGLFTKNIEALNADGTGTGRFYYLLNGGATPQAGGTEIALSASTTDQQLKDMLNATNAVLKSVTSSATVLGVLKSRIDDQTTFVANLQDSITKSIGDLIDTDMDEASSRLTALKTAQDMGTQSVSIANTMASKLLILLRGS